MEPFAGASLLLLAFVLSKLRIPAGDAVAIYAVFSFAAKIAESLPIASLAGVDVSKLSEVTLAIGYVSAVILGWRRGGSTGALAAVAGLAAAKLLDVQAAVYYFADKFYAVFSFLSVNVVDEIIKSTIAGITSVVGSTVIGSGVAVAIIYGAILANSMVNAGLTAFNRSVYRMILALTDSPAWSTLIGLGASVALGLVATMAWLVTLYTVTWGMIAIIMASVIRISEGSVWVGLGHALSALGSSILITLLFGDIRRIVSRAFRSIGGRPTLSTVAVAIVLSLLILSTFSKLLAAASIAYYMAMVFTLATATASPRPPRRTRALNAVADSLYLLGTLHIMLIAKERFLQYLEWAKQQILGLLG